MRDTSGTGASLTVTFAAADAAPRPTVSREPPPTDWAECAPELLFRSAPWALVGMAVGGVLFAVLQAARGAHPFALEAQLRDLPGGPLLHAALFLAAVAGFGCSALLRHLRERRDARAAEATLTLDADGYRLREPAVDRARSWALLEGVAENDSHLLLLDALGGAVSVPKREVGAVRIAAIRAYAGAAKGNAPTASHGPRR